MVVVEGSGGWAIEQIFGSSLPSHLLVEFFVLAEVLGLVEKISIVRGSNI